MKTAKAVEKDPMGLFQQPLQALGSSVWPSFSPGNTFHLQQSAEITILRPIHGQSEKSRPALAKK